MVPVPARAKGLPIRLPETKRGEEMHVNFAAPHSVVFELAPNDVGDGVFVDLTDSCGEIER